MMTNQKITIMLVDDHAMIREGYRSLLKKQVRLEVVAEAADGSEAYHRFKEYRPNLIIMDLSLPGQGGLETIVRIKKHSIKANILVFTMHQTPLFALQAIRAGALGYITKNSSPDILLDAIYKVHSSQRILSPDIAQALALENSGHDAIALEALTIREFEILRMLAESRSKEDIALTLNISCKTVSNCHYLIKRKLNVSSDIELTHLAIRMNIINFFDL